MASAIVSGLWSACHVVPVLASGYTPQRQFLEAGPTQSQMRALKLSLPSKAVYAFQWRQRRDRLVSIPPPMLVDWVRATSYLTMLRNKDKACEAFAKIVVGHARADEILALVRRVPYKTLVLARVKLDCTMMLCWRVVCLNRRWRSRWR